ncbi:hypothetical protein JCGZ_26508 [Jatropha curcas]|uniref:Uncharacterized protein n=1 Tax=Jatropha curcas TaxID=180498 RepID=A0A067JLB5_JATCU|nr:hypothetical protein JCGZ_26508 [Jatropha curcas]
MVNDEGDPLVLPIGPITRSRAKRYGAAISLFVQAQITQELHDVAFNKCLEEGTPATVEESTPATVPAPISLTATVNLTFLQ